MTCLHCGAAIPTSNRPYQTADCKRCGARYIVSIQEIKPPAVNEQELKDLIWRNS